MTRAKSRKPKVSQGSPRLPVPIFLPAGMRQRLNSAICASREIASRCASRLVRWKGGESVDMADNPAVFRTARDIEHKLVASKALDPETIDAVATVETFAGARLVEFRRLTSRNQNQPQRAKR